MCKEKVDLYIAENEPEFTNSLISNETAAVIDMVRDMNRMAAETTTYQLKNGLPSDEEVVAMAALGTSMQTSIKGPDWYRVAEGAGMEDLAQQTSSECLLTNLACMVQHERSKEPWVPEQVKPARAILILSLIHI